MTRRVRRCADRACGTCGPCKASAHSKRLWRDGTFARRKQTPMWDAWDDAQRRRLEELAGTRSLAEIAAVLSDEFGIPRTANAVKVKCLRFGISHWRQGWSLTDVETFFRVGHRAIVRWWIEPGLLVGTRWDGRGPFDGWLFAEAAVEAFIRQHTSAYDWRRLPRGHRLTSIAEVHGRADAWVGREVVARYVGVHPTNLDRWIGRGFVPHERRYGAGGQGEVLVRAAALPAIREAIHEARRAGKWRQGQAIAAFNRRTRAEHAEVAA